MMVYTALLLVILSAFQSCFATTEKSPVVSLNQGKIQGKKDISSKGKEFLSFLGVPYAKPPVGSLRFMNPEPPEGWEGVRDASATPEECAQMELLELMKTWEPDYHGEEDCLIVNIYTPRVDGEKNLPVMVYFHGGAFIFGGAQTYEPHELMNEDVIIVIVQYRLGALGFLSTEDSVIPGNQGLRDQSMALRWVNENIERFSGDIKRITIFGNSAGGASVEAHILSDYSNGLFSRAILQSGSLLCPWARMTKPKEVARRLGEHFGCFGGPSKGSRRLLECLQEVHARELQLATAQFYKWSFLPANTVPYADGDFFSDDFETLLRKGKQKAVDVIYGVVRDEGSFVSCPFLVMDDQRKAIKDDFSNVGPISLGLEGEESSVDLSKAAYDFYVGGVKNEPKDDDNLNRMFGDRHFSICTDTSALFHAERNQQAGKKSFFYELHHRGQRTISYEWKDPPSTRNWIAHADELQYLWVASFLGPPERNEEDARVRDLFTKMFVNFAATGNPTPDDSLGFRWDEFTPEKPKHLKITPTPTMEDDRREQERKFWKELSFNQNKLLFGWSEKQMQKDEF